MINFFKQVLDFIGFAINFVVDTIKNLLWILVTLPKMIGWLVDVAVKVLPPPLIPFVLLVPAVVTINIIRRKGAPK